MRVGVINGPNLNYLGKREPSVYGTESLSDLILGLQKAYPEVEILHFQSNVEGELINELQRLDGKVAGILLNAGGYTHTSVALRDTIKAISTPVIEVHLSNVLAREDFRHISLLAEACVGVISGFGAKSYHVALDYFMKPL